MKGIAKFSIILAVIFVVSGVLATGLFFASFDWNELNNSDYFEYLNEAENYSIQGIDSVNLDFASEDIVVEEIQGNKFVMVLSGYYPVSESGEYPELNIEKTGKELKVHVDYPQRRYIFGIDSRDSNFYIGVPENYDGDLEVGVLLGNVDIKNVELSELFVGSASGNMEISNSSFSEGSFESLSGNVKIFSSGEIRHIGTASGDVNVRNSEFSEGSIETLSGNIFVQDSHGMKSFGSASGDIEILNFDIMDNLEIETLSGDIELGLIEGSSVDLEFESLSGDLDNEFGNVHNGQYRIFVGTSSGDLKVY